MIVATGIVAPWRIWEILALLKMQYLPKHGDITLNSMIQKREKWDSHVLSRPDFWMVWRCHGIYSLRYFFFFCSELTVIKDTWRRTTSVTVMVFFSKVSFWNLFEHNYVYVQSFLSTIKRHINSSILKDTLHLKVLRTSIKMRANSFFKTWVNIIKRESMRVP